MGYLNMIIEHTLKHKSATATIVARSSSDGFSSSKLEAPNALKKLLSSKV